jgi:hypothetical protein
MDSFGLNESCAFFVGLMSGIMYPFDHPNSRFGWRDYFSCPQVDSIIEEIEYLPVFQLRRSGISRIISK